MQLYKANLSTRFKPTLPLQVAAGTLPLNFLIAVPLSTPAPAAVVWYLEFTEGNPNDPTTQWFREVDEQDTGDGVVTMAYVTRTFQLNGGGNLSVGTYAFSAHLKRITPFARLQIAVTAGSASATITSMLGTAPVS